MRARASLCLVLLLTTCWREGGETYEPDPCDKVGEYDLTPPCPELDLVCSYSDDCSSCSYRCNAQGEWEKTSCTNECEVDGPEDGVESSGTESGTEAGTESGSTGG